MTRDARFLNGHAVRVSKHAPAAERTYVGEGGVGEEREAFEQVLVVIVLDHRRPVGLEHRLRGVTKPNRCVDTLYSAVGRILSDQRGSKHMVSNMLATLYV